MISKKELKIRLALGLLKKSTRTWHKRHFMDVAMNFALSWQDVAPNSRPHRGYIQITAFDFTGFAAWNMAAQFAKMFGKFCVRDSENYNVIRIYGWSGIENGTVLPEKLWVTLSPLKENAFLGEVKWQIFFDLDFDDECSRKENTKSP